MSKRSDKELSVGLEVSGLVVIDHGKLIVHDISRLQQYRNDVVIGHDRGLHEPGGAFVAVAETLQIREVHVHVDGTLKRVLNGLSDFEEIAEFGLQEHLTGERHIVRAGNRHRFVAQNAAFRLMQQAMGQSFVQAADKGF